MSGVIMRDLATLVAQLRGDLFRRWMRRAQKKALLTWRDRTQSPGLAARFTLEGDRFYAFGQRKHDRSRIRTGRPYYVKSGDLRTMMAGRKPRSVRSDTQVVTRLKFGGGALNFLEHVNPVRSVSIEVRSGEAGVRAYAYDRITKTRGTVTIQVRSYIRRFRHRVAVLHRSGPSMAAEFGDFRRDREYIATMTSAYFLQIFRRGVLAKNGTVRSAPFAELDDEAAAAEAERIS